MPSRIDELRMVDPVLTTVAQGYSNAAMISEKLFPSVSVSKLKGKIPVFGRDSFVIRESERAVRAQSNRIPPTDLSLVEFETAEHDIEIAVDYLEEEESHNYYSYEQRVTKDLMDILMIEKEKEAADLAQDTANFAADLKEEVEAGDAWDDYTNSIDPVAVVSDAAVSIRSRIARNPNTVILGDAVYQTLIHHPKIKERIKYSSVDSVNKDLLSRLFDIPNLYIGSAVYSNDGENFSDVWADNVILAYVDRNEKQKRSEFNPSYGYTFRRDGKPEVDTYFENGGKIKVIRNTDNYVVKVTASDAAFLISNVNHS